MIESRIKKFRSLYLQLDKEALYYCRHLGYFKALLDNNDVPRVLDSSNHGRNLVLGNTEIINSVVLFVTRSWDLGKDARSIPKLAETLPSVEELQDHHTQRNISLDMQPDTSWIEEEHRNFFCERRQLSKLAQLKTIKQLRDRVLAHNLDEPNDPNRPTYDELIEVAERSILLIGKAGYLVDRVSNPYSQRIQSATASARAFWKMLPELSTLEMELGWDQI